MSFRDAAIFSSNLYYEFLKQNCKGFVEYQVIHIIFDKTSGQYLLKISKKIKCLDNICVKIGDYVYDTDEIAVISYDEKQNILTVVGDKANCLVTANLHEISVVSDLKFLIKRVRDWYSVYGDLLGLPVTSQPLQLPDCGKAKPSVQQNEAINGSLMNSFAYIWGAPGTGKTRFVLAQCVKACMQAGERIVVTAPTNNAVEQMLYGILSALEEDECSLEGIIRLGVPSAEFYEKYPQVCENSKIAKLAQQRHDELLHLESKLVELNRDIERYPAYLRFLSFSDNFIEMKGHINTLFDSLVCRFTEYNDQKEKIKMMEAKRLVLLQEVKNTKLSLEESNNRIKLLTNEVERIDGNVFKKLLKRKRLKCIERLKKEIEDNDKFTAILLAKNDDLKIIEFDLDQAKNKIKKEKVEISKVMEACEKSLNLLSVVNIPAISFSWNDIVSQINNIKDLIAEVDALVAQKSEFYKDLQGVSLEALHSKRDVILNKKETMHHEREGASRGVEKIWLTAATIDTCISRVPPDGDYIPQRIFLDEAGYASLIKGATLLAYDCPITFLGDHMQLPPVCEMNDDMLEDDDYLLVGLWAQSALYVEEVFTKEASEICRDYLCKAEPPFSKMKRYDLTYTYRFGEAVANVLANTVYGEGFHGNDKQKTQIYYINCPHMPGEKKRTNMAECLAISQYLKQFPEEDVGIITPYRNQKEIIVKEMCAGKGEEESVFTVHGAQGREWDTVIFSVVDRNNKFFTDSNSRISNGKKLINTAVSRARKKLIIACDVGHWRQQNKQLIGQLLTVAEELRIE